MRTPATPGLRLDLGPVRSEGRFAGGLIARNSAISLPAPRFSCRLGLADANETKPPRVPRAGAPLLRRVRADDLHVVPSGSRMNEAK
jgi:hypothetical protein